MQSLMQKSYAPVLCGGLTLAKSLMRTSYAPVDKRVFCDVLCAGTAHKTFLRECSYARLMRIGVGLCIFARVFLWASYARLMHVSFR